MSSPTQIKVKQAFYKIFGLSAISTMSFQIFRQNTSENYDRLIVVSCLLLGGYSFIQLLCNKSRETKGIAILSAITSIIFLIGVMGTEKHVNIDQEFLSKLWLGFGFASLLVIMLLIPSIFTLYNRELSRKTRSILVLFASLTLLLMPLAAWQGGSSIIDAFHSEYVINELLAVPSGNLPYVDFIPQYGILFSWLVAPFARFLNANELVTLGLYFMSAATIIAILVGVWLVFKATNKQSLAFAVLLVVPFTSVAKFPGREEFPGTIYSLLSALPVRIFYGMLVGALLIYALVHAKGKVFFTMTGIITGLGFWLNQDFLIAAIAVSVFIAFLGTRDFRKFLFFIFGIVIGIVFYPAILVSAGKEFDPIGILFFVLQYTSGFMAEPIQTPGPVLIILPLIVGIFFASNLPLFLERFRKIEIPQELRRAVLTSSFFSTWSLIGFAYYLNRSYASGQMQILFLPLSVAMASFFYYIMPKNQEDLPWTPRSFFQSQTWSGKGLKRTLFNLPIALAMALPLGTIIAFPNPAIEVERLTNAPAENRWPPSSISQALSRVELLKGEGIDLNQIGFFGNSGNFFELDTKVDSLNILNSPLDVPQAEGPIRVGCEYILKKGYPFILMDDAGTNVAKLFREQKLCGTYVLVDRTKYAEWLWKKA